MRTPIFYITLSVLSTNHSFHILLSTGLRSADRNATMIHNRPPEKWSDLIHIENRRCQGDEPLFHGYMPWRYFPPDIWHSRSGLRFRFLTERKYILLCPCFPKSRCYTDNIFWQHPRCHLLYGGHILSIHRNWWLRLWSALPPVFCQLTRKNLRPVPSPPCQSEKKGTYSNQQPLLFHLCHITLFFHTGQNWIMEIWAYRRNSWTTKK